MQLLRSYLAARGRQEGVTLAELMVVLVIISIIALVAVGIMVSLFDSNIRAGQYLSQQQTIETYYGFMASRLAPTQRGQVGLPYCVPAQGQSNGVCQNGERINSKCVAQAEEDGLCRTIIDPLSISGDQLVWRSNGYCYRVFYNEQRREIRAAVTSKVCEGRTVPKRGPNEPNNPSDPNDDDPALDNLNESFVLASRIIKDKPEGAPADARNPLVIFRYYQASEDPNTDSPTFPVASSVATGVPERANSANDRPADFQQATGEVTSVHPFYRELSNRGQVALVKGWAYVAGVDDDEARPRIRDRSYSQIFALNQVCDVEGTGGEDRLITPGTLIESGVVGADEPASSWEAIPTNFGDVTDLRANTQTAGQTRLLEFNAQVGMRVQSGTQEAQVLIRALLERRDGQNWVEEADANGNSRFTVSQRVPVGSAVQSVARISGTFKLPAPPPGSSATRWRVRIQAQRDSGPSNTQLNRSKQWTNLAYKVIADY